MMNDKPLTYNPWPLGNVPEELQRPELNQLKQAGYEFGDAREVINIFENKVAAFAGSKYAMAVDCCTHAVELSLRYLFHKNEIEEGYMVELPNHTYISIPQVIIQLGLHIFWYDDYKWSGSYNIYHTRVIDCAVQWKENMFVGGNFLQCLSFQIKKPICIGRGGMILTDDKEAYEWLKLAKYDGRDMSLPYDHPEHVKMIGYHYYMIPEDAARGILLMDKVKFRGDSANWTNYPDVSKYFK